MRVSSSSETTSPAKRGRKYNDVLAGARQLFLDSGYERTSMDQIARAAGVSKATVYSYFEDKHLLFIEVIRVECEKLADRVKTETPKNAPPELVLPVVARKVLCFVNSALGLGIYRLCAAESDRFPELGRMYYRSGPQLARDNLIAYLEASRDRGELLMHDTALAAQQFLDLCRSDLFVRQMFMTGGPPSEAEIAAVADSAVEVFLARYKAG